LSNSLASCTTFAEFPAATVMTEIQNTRTSRELNINVIFDPRTELPSIGVPIDVTTVPIAYSGNIHRRQINV
jgi:hypothetical protein